MEGGLYYTTGYGLRYSHLESTFTVTFTQLTKYLGPMAQPN